MAVAAGASFAAATVIGTVAATLVIGGGLYGASLLAGAALRPRNPNRSADVQQVVNQATAPRRRGYGRARLAGPRAYIGTSDGGTDHPHFTLIQAIMLVSHEIDAIEEYYIGDKKLSSAPGVITDPPFNSEGGNLLAIRPMLGTAAQAAHPDLLNYATGWTVNHRLSGIAYIVVIMNANVPVEDFQRIFPQGAHTQFTVVARLAKVFDPRDVTQNANAPGTWKWSDNNSLCIMDFLTHSDGMRKPRSIIDVPSFTAFANVCDQLVPLKAGGFERRYRMGGVYSLDEDRQGVLGGMLAACDGEFFITNEGKIGIRAGRYDAPSVTLSDSIVLDMDITEGRGALAAFNELPIIYSSPLHDYQPQEADPWVDVVAQAAHGRIIGQPLVLDWVQSHSQARRLGKIHYYKQNPKFLGKVSTNLAGMNAFGERTVTGELDLLLINEPFRITGFELNTRDMTCGVGLSSMPPTAYAWNPPTEEGTAPTPL